MEHDGIFVLTKVFNLWKVTYVLPFFIFDEKTKSYKLHTSKIRRISCLAFFSCAFSGFVMDEYFGNCDVTSLLFQGYQGLFIFYIFFSLFSTHNNARIIENHLKALQQIDEEAKLLFGGIFDNINSGFSLSVCYSIFLFLLYLAEIYSSTKSKYLSWQGLMVSLPCYILDIHFQFFYCTTKSILSSNVQTMNVHINSQRIINLDNIDIHYNKILRSSDNFFKSFKHVFLIRSFYNFFSIVSSLFEMTESGENTGDKDIYPIYILSFFWVILEAAVLLSNLNMDMDLTKEVGKSRPNFSLNNTRQSYGCFRCAELQKNL